MEKHTKNIDIESLQNEYATCKAIEYSLYNDYLQAAMKTHNALAKLMFAQLKQIAAKEQLYVYCLKESATRFVYMKCTLIEPLLWSDMQAFANCLKSNPKCIVSTEKYDRVLIDMRKLYTSDYELIELQI